MKREFHYKADEAPGMTSRVAGEVVGLSPGDTFALWVEAMRRGDFDAAWAVSDGVLRSRAGVTCAGQPRHLQSVWKGESLAGKRVLVRCYHGLGDTVQFIRFIAPLKAVAADVTVWAQPELIPLLRSLRGIDHLLPLHDGEPVYERDVDVELMELPHALRITLETLPREVPYLYAPASARPGGSADGLAVGVVWTAGEWDARRSVPVGLLEPLTHIPGVSLQVLQQGSARRNWPTGWGAFSGSRRIEGVAGIMRTLDLVITVDSLPAHLAGALGVPTWTLLRADADWRWMRERDDSPWYPTMRLFRQDDDGGWEPVIARVARELAAFARTKKPRKISAAER